MCYSKNLKWPSIGLVMVTVVICVCRQLRSIFLERTTFCHSPARSPGLQGTAGGDDSHYSARVGLGLDHQSIPSFAKMLGHE